ncbi:hypothetical protein HDV63DRAFT_390718 [Trichoderma sp. SZMC 28014]
MTTHTSEGPRLLLLLFPSLLWLLLLRLRVWKRRRRIILEQGAEDQKLSFAHGRISRDRRAHASDHTLVKARYRHRQPRDRHPTRYALEYLLCNSQDADFLP